MTRARDLASTALNSTVNTTELGYLDGVTSSVQTQLDAKLATTTAASTYATSSTVTTHTGASTGVHGVTGSVVGTTDAQTLTSKTLTKPIFSYPAENLTINAGAPFNGTQTINIVSDYGLYYFTGNATNNWTLNLRGDGSTTLASMLAVGQSLTFTMLVTNSSTAYYQTAFQIDGSAVTPKWSGGTAPAAGNASSVDVYSFTVIKTAATPTSAKTAAWPSTTATTR
jgi:hypothetical protein